MGRTKRALEELEDILRCSKCGKLPEETWVLGRSCSHPFCHPCLTKIGGGNKCPVSECGALAPAKEIRAERTLQAGVSLIRQLRRQLFEESQPSNTNEETDKENPKNNTSHWLPPAENAMKDLKENVEDDPKNESYDWLPSDNTMKRRSIQGKIQSYPPCEKKRYNQENSENEDPDAESEVSPPKTKSIKEGNKKSKKTAPSEVETDPQQKKKDSKKKYSLESEESDAESEVSPYNKTFKEGNKKSKKTLPLEVETEPQKKKKDSKKKDSCESEETSPDKIVPIAVTPSEAKCIKKGNNNSSKKKVTSEIETEFFGFEQNTKNNS